MENLWNWVQRFEFSIHILHILYVMLNHFKLYLAYGSDANNLFVSFDQIFRWVFYVWSSIFSKLTSTIVFPPDKIYFMYILLNMNGTALVCYPNEMIPAALVCGTMKMHFMLFICFFFMISSTFAHDLFTKCSCVVVFLTQINYIVVNSSFLSYRNITSRCTMLVLDNAISNTNWNV